MPLQIPLTHATLPEFVRIHKFALVHFWATWNGYDLQIRKIIESQIPSELSQRVAFGALDTDPPEHHEICRRHKILGLPFLAFYRNGSLFRTTTGLRTADSIIENLKELVDEAV